MALIRDVYISFIQQYERRIVDGMIQNLNNLMERVWVLKLSINKSIVAIVTRRSIILEKHEIEFGTLY